MNQSSISYDDSTTVILYMLPPVILLGVPGNLLVLVVIGWKNKLTSSDALILGLASVDFITCSIYLPVTWLIEAGLLQPTRLVCAFDQFLSRAVTLTSLFILISITADRYLAVSKPVFYKTSMTSRIALRVYIVSIIAATALSLPFVPLCFKLWNEIYIYFDIFTTFFSTFVSVSILFIITTYAVIIKRIFASRAKCYKPAAIGLTETPKPGSEADEGEYKHMKSKAPRKRMVLINSEDRRLVTMLLLVTVVFILLYLPTAFITTALKFANELPLTVKTGMHTLFWFNFAINPLIYAVVSKRFRKECKSRFNFRRNQPNTMFSAA